MTTTSASANAAIAASVPSGEVVFSTVHGSHLYGLAHDQSDQDIFKVTMSARTRARHTFNNVTGIDSCVMGLDTFLRRVYEGSHQSVEALFSPYKEWGDGAPVIKDYLENYRVTGSQVFAKYERTIHRFVFGDFKRRRHAVRLALNLADLRSEGRFNPVLSLDEIRYCNMLAQDLEGDMLWKELT